MERERERWRGQRKTLEYERLTRRIEYLHLDGHGNIILGKVQIVMVGERMTETNQKNVQGIIGAQSKLNQSYLYILGSARSDFEIGCHAFWNRGLWPYVACGWS